VKGGRKRRKFRLNQGWPTRRKRKNGRGLALGSASDNQYGEIEGKRQGGARAKDKGEKKDTGSHGDTSNIKTSLEWVVKTTRGSFTKTS